VSTAHLMRILRTLDETKPAQESGIAPILHEVAERVNRRGMVVIVGVFYQRSDKPSLRDWEACKAAVGTVSISTQGVTSNVRITAYASNTAPVPIIKNEELILLRAEARLATGDRAGAIADLNLVRTVSGGLAPLPASFAGDLVDEILYNRRYSLFYEYGHRWVDLRRYGRLNTLEKALPSHRVFPIVPIPVDECNQRSPAPRGCVQVSGS